MDSSSDETNNIGDEKMVDQTDPENNPNSRWRQEVVEIPSKKIRSSQWLYKGKTYKKSKTYNGTL